MACIDEHVILHNYGGSGLKNLKNLLDLDEDIKLANHSSYVSLDNLITGNQLGNDKFSILSPFLSGTETMIGFTIQ